MMGSHKTCQYCDYCIDTDMRCMNTESQWAGCTVKPDNYCRLFILRSSLSLPEFRKYLIDLSIDGLKEDVAELYELLKAKEQGRIKFVKKAPEGACCGNCADFIRKEGTARGTCRTQKRKRCGHYGEFRKVAQSTKACGEFKEKLSSTLNGDGNG